MHSQERVLLRRAMETTALVERILKRDYGVKWFGLKKEDEIRLLRLRQWEEKYRVSVAWILAHLLPVWRQKYAKHKSSTGLGVMVGTLVGQASERILREAIAKEYPEERTDPALDVTATDETMEPGTRPARTNA